MTWRQRVPTWARLPLTIIAIVSVPFWILPALAVALVVIVYMNIWHPDKCRD